MLCAVAPGASSAQQNSGSPPADRRATHPSAEAIVPWLLNPDEGLAIIGAALESRHTDSNADCSNLVHAIYERAGFAYSYANSSELYRGIKAFRQVLHPHPGDLVVWRGHVGIVISPVQHSFFSAMRSGRGVEFYDSPYWEAFGRARFFRYLRAGRPTLVSASTRRANLKPGSSRSAEPEDPVSASGDAGVAPKVSMDEPAAASSDLPSSHPRVGRMASPAASSGVDGTSVESLHASESGMARAAQSPALASHEAEGLAAGATQNAAAGRLPGRPFGSVATPAPRYVPRPPQGFWASSTAARNRNSTRKSPPRM